MGDTVRRPSTPISLTFHEGRSPNIVSLGVGSCGLIKLGPSEPPGIGCDDCHREHG